MKREEIIRILGETTLCSALGNAAFAAIEDVKKQIPEEVVTDTEDDREFEDYICPNCKNILQQRMKGATRITVYKYKYCPNCGKALKWETVR